MRAGCPCSAELGLDAWLLRRARKRVLMALALLRSGVHFSGVCSHASRAVTQGSPWLTRLACRGVCGDAHSNESCRGLGCPDTRVGAVAWAFAHCAFTMGGDGAAERALQGRALPR